MHDEPLAHYLRTIRRRTGLPQSEVALLLGVSRGSKISRYERMRRKPPLEAALAYEAIFGVAVRELFAGTFHQVDRAIRRRAASRIAELRSRPPNKRNARTLLALLSLFPEPKR